MTDQTPNSWKPTAKLPLLVLGVFAVLLGWFLTLRGTMKALIIGGVLILGGLGMIVWSSSIHNWCVPDDMKWGSGPFTKMRFHDGPPVLQDCLAWAHLANPVGFKTFDQIKAAHEAKP